MTSRLTLHSATVNPTAPQRAGHDLPVTAQASWPQQARQARCFHPSGEPPAFPAAVVEGQWPRALKPWWRAIPIAQP